MISGDSGDSSPSSPNHSSRRYNLLAIGSQLNDRLSDADGRPDHTGDCILETGDLGLPINLWQSHQEDFTGGGGHRSQLMPRFIKETDYKTICGITSSSTSSRSAVQESDTIATSLSEHDCPAHLESESGIFHTQSPEARLDHGKDSTPVEPSNKATYLYLLYSTLFETYTAGDRQKIIDLLNDVSVLHKLADYNSLPSELTSTLSGRNKSYGLYGIFAQSDHESSFLNHVTVFALNVEFRQSMLPEPPGIGPLQNQHTQDSNHCFGCGTCGKNFDCLKDLNHHERTHAQLFMCDTCHAGFPWAKDLKRHLTKHSGERHYSCDVCQHAFTRKDNLLRHIRKNQCFSQTGQTALSSTPAIREYAGSGQSSRQYLEPPSESTAPTTPSRNQNNGRKRKEPHRNDDVPNDGDGIGNSPASSPLGGLDDSQKLVCIYHRFDPETYGNGNRNFRSCRDTGFKHIATLRSHIRRKHDGRCGEHPGCAPTNHGPNGDIDREMKWRMEYRQHIGDGNEGNHCVYWSPPPNVQSFNLLSPNSMNDGLVAGTSSYSPSESSAPRHVSMAFGALRLDPVLDAQMNRLNSENQRLNSENERLNSQVNEARSERDTARAETEALRTRLHQVESEYAAHLAHHRPYGLNNQPDQWTNQNTEAPLLQQNSLGFSTVDAATLPIAHQSFPQQTPAVNEAATMLNPSTTNGFDFGAQMVSPEPYTFEGITPDPVTPSGTVNPAQLRVPPRTEGSSQSETATLVNDGPWNNTGSINQLKIPMRGVCIPDPNEALGWSR